MAHYNKELCINGELDTNLVLLKMNSLRDRHLKDGMSKEYSIKRGFEFGRNLIGFDMSEAWKMGQN